MRRRAAFVAGALVVLMIDHMHATPIHGPMSHEFADVLGPDDRRWPAFHRADEDVWWAHDDGDWSRRAGGRAHAARWLRWLNGRGTHWWNDGHGWCDPPDDPPDVLDPPALPDDPGLPGSSADPPAPVPEPATVVLFSVGLLCGRFLRKHL